jgi:hypothetical protein
VAAFATHTDLAARLGVTLTADEQSRATTLLGLASDVIRRAARQNIDRATSTIKVISAADRVLLPQRPVISIDSVTRDGSAFVDHMLDGDYLAGSWSGGTIQITYTHGYDPVPDAIKAICLEVVTRVWVNPGKADQEAYGSERVSHGANVGLVLTDEERKAVRDVVRRGSQSVDVR